MLYLAATYSLGILLMNDFEYGKDKEVSLVKVSVKVNMHVNVYKI